jgi:hypothetical protein
MRDVLTIKEIDTRRGRFVSQKIAEQSREWTAADVIERYREPLMASLTELCRCSIRNPDPMLSKAIDLLTEMSDAFHDATKDC